MRSDGEKSPRSTPVTVPKKKRGFCECCQETFEELQKVKVPWGPGSLQKLRGSLSSFIRHVMFSLQTILEGRQMAMRTARVMSSGISLVAESRSVPVLWAGQTMVLKIGA